MGQDNVELVRRLYTAYQTGDIATVTAALAPDIRWHNSGTDTTAGTYEGVEAVLNNIAGDNHMDDYSLELVDMLSSDQRVAVVARTSGRRGDRQIVNDYVQLIRIDDGRIAEVWNYNWDQKAIAEFMEVPMTTAR